MLHNHCFCYYCFVFCFFFLWASAFPGRALIWQVKLKSSDIFKLCTFKQVFCKTFQQNDGILVTLWSVSRIENLTWQWWFRTDYESFWAVFCLRWLQNGMLHQCHKMDKVIELSYIKSLQHVPVQLDTENGFSICGHRKKLNKKERKKQWVNLQSFWLFFS